MAKTRGWLNGHKWLVIAVPVMVALVGMWQYTAANTAELRERLTAVETVIPLIYEQLGKLEKGQAAIGALLMDRLPK